MQAAWMPMAGTRNALAARKMEGFPRHGVPVFNMTEAGLGEQGPADHGGLVLERLVRERMWVCTWPRADGGSWAMGPGASLYCTDADFCVC